MQYVNFSYIRIRHHLIGIMIALLSAMTLLLVLASSTNAQSDDARGNCDQLIVSGHTGYPPFNFTENGVFRGASIDLIRLIAREIGIHFEIRNVGPWIRAVKNLTDGEIDLLVAIYHTPEREEHYIYTEPYAEDPIVMFTMASSEFAFDDWYDLVGKVGVTTRGDSWGADFDHFIEQHLTMMRVNTTDQMIDMIAQDRANYGVQGLFTLERSKRRIDFAGDISISSTPIKSEAMYMAISRKSPCQSLLDQINEAINNHKDDGAIEKLIATYVRSSGS